MNIKCESQDEMDENRMKLMIVLPLAFDSYIFIDLRTDCMLNQANLHQIPPVHFDALALAAAFVNAFSVQLKTLKC